MTKRFAYSYLRMSTDIQLKGDSRRRQLELSQNYAEQNDLVLLDRMEDIGVSAFHGKNLIDGSLGKFVVALKNGEIEPNSVLLVESLDRLSRENVLSAFGLFSTIIDLGIEIITLADNQRYTKESLSQNNGQIFLTLGSMLRANDESATKSRRLSASWKNKRTQVETHILTKQSPAWLTVKASENHFEPIKEAAEVVKQIFQWSIEGIGAYAITRKLNVGNYPTIGKSKFWHKSYVTKILNNPAVHGEFQPMSMQNGKRTPIGPQLESYYPEIIDKETFLLSRTRTENRRLLGGGRKGKSLNNLFTKLIECSKCESSVVFINKGNGPKGGKYLQCYNSKSKAGCNCPPWRYDEFELSFFKYVSEIDIKDIAQNSEVEKTKKQLRADVEILNAKISLAGRKMSNLISSLEEDIPKTVKDDVIKRINLLESESQDCQDKADKLSLELKSIESSNISATKELSENYLSYLSSNSETAEDFELRHKLHQALVSTIYVVELINEPIDSVPYYSQYQLNRREINYLTQGKEYTEDQLDDFILTPSGNRILNKIKRSFRVYFKNGSVREVNPDTNISSIVSQSRESLISKLHTRKNMRK